MTASKSNVISGVCLCSKWSEPQVRDFDGRSIPLLPTCRYTMLDVSGLYKVDMVLKHQSTDGVPQNQQDTRIIYGRPHSYLEITINNKSVSVSVSPIASNSPSLDSQKMLSEQSIILH